MLAQQLPLSVYIHLLPLCLILIYFRSRSLSHSLDRLLRFSVLFIEIVCQLLTGVYVHVSVRVWGRCGQQRRC